MKGLYQIVTNLPANQLTLKKGKPFTLKTKVTVKGNVSKKVAYKTSNSKIATVSSKGKITAVAKDGSGKKKTCTIKVINPIKITSLKVTDDVRFKLQYRMHISWRQVILP